MTQQVEAGHDEAYYTHLYGPDIGHQLYLASNNVQAQNGQLQSAPPYVDAATYAAMSPQEQIASQMISDAKVTRADNRNAVMAGGGAMLQADAGLETRATAEDQARLAQSGNLYDQTTGQLGDAVARQQAASTGATNMDVSALQNLSGIYGTASQQGQRAAGSVAQAGGAANIYGQQLFGGLVGQADAANQTQTGIGNRLYDQVSGLAPVANTNGVDPINSAAAGAQADPNAIAMQRNAAQRFLDVASGGANLSSAAAGAQADPQALAAQHQILSQYQAGTNPNMTATERYMMEQARRTEEQGRRSAMDAQLADLQARGIRSGGAEIGAMLGSSQITSQNRMLQDMAAQANAQQRSERMMQGGAGLAGDISAQSFGQSLDRGSAADQFGLANRQTALQALGSYAGLGDVMRGSSFNEGFSTGQAGDQMAQFNANNSLKTQQYNAELQRQQNNDIANRAMGVAGVQTNAATDAYGRASNVYGAGATENNQRVARADTAADASMKAADQSAGYGTQLMNATAGRTDAAYGREAAGAGMQVSVAGDVNQAGRQLLGDQQTATTDAFNRGKSTVNDIGNVTGMYTDQGNTGAQQVASATKSQQGQLNADEAAALLKKQPGGLLGGSIIPGVL